MYVVRGEKEAESQKMDALELWCWRKLLRVLWTARRIKPVHPKENQSWIFSGRTDAETEAPILWPPDAKNWLIGKEPDAGKDWRQEEKSGEMVGWHHRLNGHESEQAQTHGNGQLQSMGSQRVRQDWMTELTWTKVVVSKLAKTEDR